MNRKKEYLNAEGEFEEMDLLDDAEDIFSDHPELFVFQDLFMRIEKCTEASSELSHRALIVRKL